MEEYTVIQNLNEISIKKIFNEYQIKLNSILDSIHIIIQTNSYDLYETYFKLNFLNQLFKTNKSKYDLIEFLSILIEENKINIEINEKNLKLILITFNIELLLNKKSKLCEEVIEILIKEISDLKFKNKELNEKILVFEEENKKQKNEIKEQKMKIDIYDKKINQLFKNMKILEKFHSNEYKNNKIKIKECDLKLINSIEEHNDGINSISILPSGKIISVSYDKTVKIWDINFNILQNIKDAHNKGINYVDIKDENNFVTCSYDKIIKTWIKVGNYFQTNQIINNAHNDEIKKIIYLNDNNIISCSDDKTIKIWELINNKYQLILTLNHSNCVKSLLLLKDKNILISSGEDGTKFWNIYNFNLIDSIKNAYCGTYNALERIDENRIIVGGKDSLKVISLLNKKIIESINIEKRCKGIKIIENKGILLVSEWSHDIKIFTIDNYKCIKIIKDAHNLNICGFIILKNGLIASYCDNIKIWKLIEIK